MNALLLEYEVWLAIGLAALVTYGLRLSGLLLAGRMPKTGRVKRFMDALPGTILLSLIVPAAVGAGPPGWVATAVTGWCSVKNRQRVHLNDRRHRSRRRRQDAGILA